MGLLQKKSYQKFNRSTGKFEWVHPKPTKYISGIEGGRGGKLKINVRNIKPIN